MTLHNTQAKIPITQSNIPLPPVGTVIAAPGSTGVEQPPKRSRLMSAIHELRHLLRPILPDAVSSEPASLEGVSMPAQPDPSSENFLSQPDLTVTSLSIIGMSLETDKCHKSGFHLVFHCI